MIKGLILFSDYTLRGEVDAAAKRLAVPRSKFLASAAQRCLQQLRGLGLAAATNRAVADTPDDHAFTDAAAALLSARARRDETR